MNRPEPSPGMSRWAAAALAGVVALTASACSSQTAVRTQRAGDATVVPTDKAKVPDGWVVRRGPGFQVAVPPQWQTRPDDQRAAPSAALEVGVPFTGQALPPPLLLAFVERERVGPLQVREPVLRAQLKAGLPEGATLGESKHVDIAGGSDAVTFDVVYADEGGTSLLGTPLKPTTVRQRELIVETPGLPKYGFRYSASVEEFDADLWRQIEDSIVVLPSDPTPSG